MRPGPDLHRAAALPVVETFHSLQGEGAHAGRSAFFIRLAGCDVGCSWCDTRHSWQLEDHPRRSVTELARETAAAAAAGAAFAVITGGEPLMHDLGPLCLALEQGAAPLPLHLETSGAVSQPLTGRFGWITLSPKRHRPPALTLLAACDELKVVVHEPADLVFAEAMAQQAIEARKDSAHTLSQSRGLTAPVLLLQPGWNCRRGQELAIAHVRAHPAWRLSLQSHKWLGVR